MAYVVRSLASILEQVLHPNHQHLILECKPQIRYLFEKSNDFIDFLQVSNWTPVIEEVKDRIRDAALGAEYIILTHISDQILSKSTSSSSLDLIKVTEEFDSIFKDMKMIKEAERGWIPADHSFLRTDHLNLTCDNATSNSDAVFGINDEFMQLVGRVMSEQSRHGVISIVGVKGIGKTTLARLLYNDRYIRTIFFDSSCWITISQEYNEKDTLLAILSCLTKVTEEMSEETIEQLEQHVKAILERKAILFMVDNINDIEIWDKIRRLFPDEKNGSRIILTSRLLDVANYASDTPSNILHMTSISMERSWYLLCHKASTLESCPSDLEEIGKKIAYKCMGHPTIIAVIGGLLGTCMTQDFWGLVLEEISVEGIDYGLHLLSVGYDHLPHHLKPCFIYFGGFQGEYDIRASKIIKLWIAEGLIEPIADRTLEEIGEIYLRDLIGRNLVESHKQKCTPKLEFVRTNSLLWELCKKKAVDEKVLWINDLDGHNNIIAPQNTTVTCHLIRDDNINTHDDKMAFAHSFVCTGNVSLNLAPVLLGLRLLRTLDVYEIKLYQFPVEILQLIYLKYLALTCCSTLPSSISVFWHLQTLIVRRLPSFRAFTLPSEVWEMTQLRHIKSKEAGIWYYCPNPSNEKDDDVVVVQENVQTLSNMQMLGLTNEVLKKFPNLIKLGLFCDVALNGFIDLAYLHKLETLKCSSDWSPATQDFLSHLIFPNSLRKLTLRFCRIHYGFMSVVGMLPNLEQLKLQKCDFLGIDWMPSETEPVMEPTETDLEQTEPEWNLAEGEFLNLQFLLLEDLNLVHWIAEDTNFPSLRHLVVRDCFLLKKIPIEIRYMGTLEQIEVYGSSPSVRYSARLRQAEIGNDYLHR